MMNQKEIEEKVEIIGNQNHDLIMQLVAEGKLPEPRSLTRKERKALDAAELNVFKTKPSDTRSLVMIREDCADWIMDHIYPDFDFDLPNNICLWFGNYIFGITYRDDLSEKN